MEELIGEFLVEAGESLEAVDQELVRLEGQPDDAEALNAIFRLVHTIKGTSGFLGLEKLQAVTHAAETLLGKFRDGELAVTAEAVTLVLSAVDRVRAIMDALAATGAEPAESDAALIARLDAMSEGGAAPEAEAPDAHASETPDADAPAADAPDAEPDPAEAPAAAGPAAERRAPTTEQGIRVGVEVLEDMMTLISELVLTRNQLLQVNRSQIDGAFSAPLQRLSTITGELQESIMKTRVQPIGAAWKKLPRMVRDLARDVGKDIRLDLEGEATELDRQVLDLIRDPLTHMVRNSADHGLETPAQRLAAGKPATGVIRVTAAHESGSVVITIGDDGRGLDPDRLRAKALAKGLISPAEAETMTEAQVLRLIFAPGFSTAETVTNISGRGVGMDVVRSNIEQIGGQIDLHNDFGRGATFTIRIPLTLAIMPALVVGASGQRFALPQSSVVELVRLGAGGALRIETVGGARLLRLRDALVPLVTLAAALELAEPEAPPRFVAVAEVGGRRFGLLLDEVLDTEEIVVKPLSTRLRDLARFSGATILGDGSVILIVDMNSLAALAGEAPARAAEALEAHAWIEAAAADAASMLLVDTGGGCPMVIDLARVTRLEHAATGRIERTGGRLVMRYRDRLTPVIVLGDTRLRAEGAQPMVVLTTPGGPVALAVERILDIHREALVIELQPDRPGVLGAAVVNGAAVEVLDVDHYARAAADCFQPADAPPPIAEAAA